MNFDFNATLKSMIGAMQGAISENISGAQGIAEKFLSAKKDAIKDYAQQRLDGEIDDDDLGELMKDEMRLLEMEKNAGIAIGKATAQKAINSAIQVLENALKTTLGSVI